MTILAAFILAAAQDVLDPVAADHPRGHDLVRAATGECVVAWVSGRKDRRVMARRFAGAWAPPVAVDTYRGDANEVAISTDGERYLVVWSTGAEVSGRLLDRRLAPLGASFRVSDLPDAGDDTAPSAAWNRDRWLVVWSHTNVPASGDDRFTVGFEINDDVRGRFVTPAGPSGASFAIAEDALDSKNASVAPAKDGWIVTWQEHPGPQRPPRVWGAPVGSDGTVGPAAPYGIGTGANQERPKVASRADGRSLMTWKTQLGGAAMIGARPVEPDGRYAGGAFRLGERLSGAPSVVHVPERRQYLVAYEFYSGNRSFDVNAAWIDEETMQVCEVVRLMASHDDDRYAKAVALPNGEPLTAAVRKPDSETTELVVTSGEYKGRDNPTNTKGCSASANGPAGPIFLAALLAWGLATWKR